MFKTFSFALFNLSKFQIQIFSKFRNDVCVRKVTGDKSCDSDIELADTVEKSVLMETNEQTTLKNQFDEFIEGTSIGSWLSSIDTEAKLTISDSDDGDRDNLMYNPGFVKYFIDLCKLYPHYGVEYAVDSLVVLK